MSEENEHILLTACEKTGAVFIYSAREEQRKDYYHQVNLYASGMDPSVAVSYKDTKVGSIVDNGDGLEITVGNTHTRVDYAQAESLRILLNYLNEHASWCKHETVKTHVFKKVG